MRTLSRTGFRTAGRSGSRTALLWTDEVTPGGNLVTHLSIQVTHLGVDVTHN